MADFFELDFLDVETQKSGDAIALRYQIGHEWLVHVVDGGYQETGPRVEELIRTHYRTDLVNHVVLTHPDSDHAGGLRAILENLRVNALWMHRPWEHVTDLLGFFPGVSSADYLRRVLREGFPNVVALEEIALRRGIPIYSPFQGAKIGAFTVLTPSYDRYLELVARSDCTPASPVQRTPTLTQLLGKAMAHAKAFVQASWGTESFSPDSVSPANEMSVVQFARIAGEKILLTADAGREGLAEAIAYAPYVGLDLPGIDRFQVPHHGSRRNLSTAILDQLLGPRLSGQLFIPTFTAIISSAKADPDHPRRAVVRAMWHRGAQVVSTESGNLRSSSSAAPLRPGYGSASRLPYPMDQESD
jgi:beta-lactamase superfamily II metal-dependent hydrolase